MPLEYLYSRGVIFSLFSLNSKIILLASKLEIIARVIPMAIAKLKPKESVNMQIVERNASMP